MREKPKSPMADAYTQKDLVSFKRNMAWMLFQLAEADVPSDDGFDLDTDDVKDFRESYEKFMVWWNHKANLHSHRLEEMS